MRIELLKKRLLKGKKERKKKRKRQEERKGVKKFLKHKRTCL